MILANKSTCWEHRTALADTFQAPETPQRSTEENRSARLRMKQLFRKFLLRRMVWALRFGLVLISYRALYVPLRFPAKACATFTTTDRIARLLLTARLSMRTGVLRRQANQERGLLLPALPAARRKSNVIPTIRAACNATSSVGFANSKTHPEVAKPLRHLHHLQSFTVERPCLRPKAPETRSLPWPSLPT